MRSDFCAFILTHGRPDSVHTYNALLRSGYTGRIIMLIDDEDSTGQEYRERFGDCVRTFSKEQISKTFDEADNFTNRKTIVYARNACFEIAKREGLRYFIQLDDDYFAFYIRFCRIGDPKRSHRIRNLDFIFEAMVNFLEESQALTFCMGQGGDHIGGFDAGKVVVRLTRKAMNSFVCDVERPFLFRGRINEDVSTYAEEGRRGGLFFTAKTVQLCQVMTQQNPGGMTETYLDGGTYVKSFYSVMFCPSAVKIGELSDPRSPHRRIHHRVNWNACAPKILREGVRKGSAL